RSTPLVAPWNRRRSAAACFRIPAAKSFLAIPQMYSSAAFMFLICLFIRFYNPWRKPFQKKRDLLLTQLAVAAILVRRSFPDIYWRPRSRLGHHSLLPARRPSQEPRLASGCLCLA